MRKKPQTNKSAVADEPMDETSKFIIPKQEGLRVVIGKIIITGDSQFSMNAHSSTKNNVVNGVSNVKIECEGVTIQSVDIK